VRLEVAGPGPTTPPALPLRVCVVGGGIAGLAATTVLAERGAKVSLVERERYLGGRAGSWTDTLSTGERFEMERGFHAFFRQYYNLRRLLRRVDPELDDLAQARDYPILGPDGEEQSFADLPRRAPWNVAALTRRSRHLGARDLLKVNGRAALAMLGFHPERTYARHDQATASDYLDSLRFPPAARRMLFDVFAHSFFNPESEMSAAELLMMFHFYFLGNREGLIFDVARRPLGVAYWQPLADRAVGLGASVTTGVSAQRVVRHGGAFVVETDGASITADALVLALTVPALQALVADSPALAALDHEVSSLALTRPFAVWRLWLDRPTRSDRVGFVGTTGIGRLDNISLFHLLEDESQAWADKTGGAVVELHAYAVEADTDQAALRAELLAGLHTLYPETRDARIVEERFLWREDCPAFSPGSHARRPSVTTAVPGVMLAGDFVKLPMPSALMERAATSGMLAANNLLAKLAAPLEPIQSIAPHGLLHRLPV
jgi:isorenieratene synthase